MPTAQTSLRLSSPQPALKTMHPTLTLPQTVARAEALRTLCAAPGMNAYRPIAVSAVKVCFTSASIMTQKTDKLAAYVVDQTAILINTMAHMPISPEILKALASIRTLDAIRRHIEQTPGKRAKFFVNSKFKRETKRLKVELETHLYTLPGNVWRIGSDCVLELVSLGTRAAGARPQFPEAVIGIPALICDSAKSVKSNRDAAIALAMHVSSITKCIVDRASAMDAAAADTGDALEALKSYSHLLSLGRPRRRLAPWIFANREKERFAELSGALDKALAMFMASTLLRTAASSGQIGVVLSKVEGLERSGTDLDRKLTILHAEVDSLHSVFGIFTVQIFFLP
ncbi:hypothetical protein B0H17DRAFT_1205403 [Mycena rosella]|uniref:Uncharacterized protein n=1 Tax=Mycena rosella TaxID=1033263 RepID=A0AAD7D7G4_MYCRO|nr:hypothetical protein B0H17DRAFT_1205403 [Mycena rosella]